VVNIDRLFKDLAVHAHRLSQTQRRRRPFSTVIYSWHLPAAGDAHIDRFLKVLESVPDAEPFVAPNPEAFDEMMRQIVAAAPPGP
jgi:hypothetical protein